MTLDEMADRLAAVQYKYGPHATVGASGAASAAAPSWPPYALIGSPNWMINQDPCGGQALSEKLTGTPMKNGEDIDNARTAMLVGRNPYAADPGQWQSLKALKRVRPDHCNLIHARPASGLADIWLDRARERMPLSLSRWRIY